jgi:hypothetical protein
MSSLRNDLLVAYQAGDFLRALNDKLFNDKTNSNDLADELVSLHNEGLIDVIDGFRDLRNEPGTGGDFFIIRHILEQALPRLRAPILPVMDCVLHLTREAGHDMAAGTLYPPFIEYCTGEPSRPKESIKHIEASGEHLADLLVPIIIAGTSIDVEFYLNEAIRLTNHENIEIRKRAIFSLGRIQINENLNFYARTLTCLELSVNKENDDELLGNIIRSAFRLYKQDKLKSERTTDLIKSALSESGDFKLYVASELLWVDFDELPETLLDTLLVHLRQVRPQHKGTINNIDYGLVKLLEREDPIKGIELLENLLLANSDDLSLGDFDDVARMFLMNNDILGRLLTRWFLRGERVLCEGVRTIINLAHGYNMQLSINPSELNLSDSAQIPFLARKAIGYLFSTPVTAASIIISLIEHAKEKATIGELSELLFDPLLINYPGQVQEYLSRQTESEKVGAVVEAVLKLFNEYLADLRSTGEIPELHPSQAHRDAYQRYFSRLVSESMKKAEKDSVFLSIFPKSVLLYGRKSISRVYGSDGQSERVEFPLKSYSTGVELPRHDIIDHFGLDYMLVMFRAEKSGHETDN